MKMSNELFNELSTIINDRLKGFKVGPVSPTLGGCLNRKRWDIFWASDGACAFLRKCHDAGLDDRHIDTALRKILDGKFWKDGVWEKEGLT